VQFTASVILICMSLAIYRQMQHLTSHDLGISIDNTLVIRNPVQSPSRDSLRVISSDVFETHLMKESWVKGVTQSSVVPGADINEISSNSAILRLGAEESEGSYNYYHFRVKENYPELMELELIAGKGFDYQSPREMILISERARENLGFVSAEEAIGQKLDFQMYGKPSEIVGVFKNFHQRSPKERFLPLIIYQSDDISNFIVKLNTGDGRQALVDIRRIWDDLFPGNVFDYYFLNDQYNQQYHQDMQFGKTILLFTFLALVIAGLGLFGLSSYLVLLRTKEIGIRKVLGASVGSLIGLLTNDFLSVILLAGIMGIPVAYFLIPSWLENYALGLDPDWPLFVLPLMIILGIALLTFGGQTNASAPSNTVDSLSTE
jgi:putative ABC transport system permease protein